MCANCGHDRDHHAWGIGECELILPAWVCPVKCKFWVAPSPRGTID